MFGLGAPEMLIVAVVVILLFGSTKLPKLARSLGEAKKEMQQAQAESDAVPVHAVVAAPSALTARADDSVTMRVEDLEALLASREERARAEQHPFSAA